MNLNFGYARKKGGICYLRFDDTNPQAEKDEYIQSIIQSVSWLGHHPGTTRGNDFLQPLINCSNPFNFSQDYPFIGLLSPALWIGREDDWGQLSRVRDTESWLSYNTEYAIRNFDCLEILHLNIRNYSRKGRATFVNARMAWCESAAGKELNVNTAIAPSRKI